MPTQTEAATNESSEAISWRQRTLGTGIMGVSLVVGVVGLEQSIDPPHSIDSTLVVGALLGLIVGNEVLKN